MKGHLGFHPINFISREKERNQMTAFNTFDDLVFEPRKNLPGIQAKEFWVNGYGVSVIRGRGTLGETEGLYELAVLKGNASDWSLCYETPITDDVIGYLTPENVTTHMVAVQALPALT
jgi:hypothetical protein